MNNRYIVLFLIFCITAFSSLNAQVNVTIPPCVDCPTGGSSSSLATCTGFDSIVTYGYNRNAIVRSDEVTFLSGNNSMYTVSSLGPGVNDYNIYSVSGYTQLLNGFQDINENWVDYIQADILYQNPDGNGFHYYNYMLVLNDAGDLYFKIMFKEPFFRDKIPLTAGALATTAPPTSASDPLLVNSGVLNTLGAPLKFSHLLEASGTYYSSRGIHTAFAYSEDDGKVYSWGGLGQTTLGNSGYYGLTAASQLLFRDVTTTLESSTPKEATVINNIISRNGTAFKADDPVLDYKSGFSDNFYEITYANSYRTILGFITEDGVVNFVRSNANGNVRMILPNGEKAISLTGIGVARFYITSDAGKVYAINIESYADGVLNTVDQIHNVSVAEEYFAPAGETVISFDINFNLTDQFALTADGDLLKYINKTTFDDWTDLYNIPKIGKILYYSPSYFVAETKVTKQIISISRNPSTGLIYSGGVPRDLNGAPFVGGRSRWGLAYSCIDLE